MKRLVDFSDETGVVLELAYYPPYHSKYNPIERVWGVLEQHWNGTLLSDFKTVVAMAQSMTYKTFHPMINIIKRSYQTGITLSKSAMDSLENRLDRRVGLRKYALSIFPKSFS